MDVQKEVEVTCEGFSHVSTGVQVPGDEDITQITVSKGEVLSQAGTCVFGTY